MKEGKRVGMTTGTSNYLPRSVSSLVISRLGILTSQLTYRDDPRSFDLSTTQRLNFILGERPLPALHGERVNSV